MYPLSHFLPHDCCYCCIPLPKRWFGLSQRYYSFLWQASNAKKKHISTVPVHDRLRINAWQLFFFIISMTVWIRHLLNCVPGQHQQLSSDKSMAHNALNSGKADPKQPCLSNKVEDSERSCGEPAKMNESRKWTFHGLDLWENSVQPKFK